MCIRDTSEFYATIKAAAAALGARAMAEDLGIELGVNICTDASASKAMVSRRGFGKAKHISRCFLWIQQRIRDKEVRISKVGTNDNPADLGTKFLELGKIRHLLSLLSLRWCSGVHTLGLKAAVSAVGLGQPKWACDKTPQSPGGREETYVPKPPNPKPNHKKPVGKPTEHE